MTSMISIQPLLEKETDKLTKTVELDLKEQDKLIEVDDKINLELKLTRINKEKILVRFKATVKAQLTCVRCLKKFSKEIPLNFERVYKTQSKGVDDSGKEAEKEAEMGEELKIEGDKINIKKPLHDELIMNLPPKPVCSEDCQGLCQICGQNLNKGSCDCGSQPQGRKEFQKLKKLKEKKDARTKKTD